MLRQLTTQTSVFTVVDDRAFLITLIRLKNTPSGAPRYKALITDMDNAQAAAWDANQHGTCAYVYTFKGHYDTEKGEAEWILNYHLERAE